MTFQRTKTWKESNDPRKEEKLDRIEEVLFGQPDRVFAFDEFGPLAVHPVAGCCWAERAPASLGPTGTPTSYYRGLTGRNHLRGGPDTVRRGPITVYPIDPKRCLPSAPAVTRLATSTNYTSDRELATAGYFFMAMDTAPPSTSAATHRRRDPIAELMAGRLERLDRRGDWDYPAAPG